MGELIELDRYRRPRESRQPQTDTEAPVDEPGRDEHGRFLPRITVGLLDLLREIAIYAAAHLYGSPIDPREVDQEHWDQAARVHEATYGRIAEGRQIVARLRKLTGRHYHWREWLLIALDEEKDLAKVLAALVARSANPPSPVQAVESLRAMAQRLGRKRFSTPEYEREFALWRVEEQRAHRGAAFEERMLNSEQIITAFGSWTRAVLAAGLEPPVEQRLQQKGLPVADAIACFYAQRGFLPTRKELFDFSQTSDFSLASQKNKGWHGYLDEGIRRIADFPQLPAPPAYGTKEPDDWEPITIEIELPPRKTRRYTRIAALEAVEDFTDWLQGKAPTNRAYRSYVTGRPDRPGLNAILVHGTLNELVTIVADPNWRTR